MALTNDEKKELIEKYKEKASVFNEVSAEEADNFLENQSGHTIYIGRNNCPFCQKFVNKLSPLAKKQNLEVYYVDTNDTEQEEEINEFRNKYDVPTVPGLLYSSEKAGLRVKCDSSLTEEEILKIIEED